MTPLRQFEIPMILENAATPFRQRHAPLAIPTLRIEVGSTSPSSLWNCDGTESAARKM